MGVVESDGSCRDDDAAAGAILCPLIEICPIYKVFAKTRSGKPPIDVIYDASNDHVSYSCMAIGQLGLNDRVDGIIPGRVNNKLLRDRFVGESLEVREEKKKMLYNFGCAIIHLLNNNPEASRRRMRKH